VVGYAFAIVRDRPDGAFLSARRTLSFEHLAVAESAWEIGVGGLLIRAVRQVARAVGASYIHLMVWNFNRHAIDVYEHADYRMRRHSTV
jgi:GNAT superfamily N-acetyltransferase